MVIVERLGSPSVGAKSSEPLVPAETGAVEFAPGKVAWLYSVLGAASLVMVESADAGAWVASAALLAVTLCAGHSVGLHRGVIHGSYRCSKLLRGVLVYLFVHTGIGGPISWIRLHHLRDYQQNAARCPRFFRYEHSAARDYLWNLHLRFVPRDPSAYAIPQEDERDAWLSFLERTWPLHVIGLGVLLWVTCGAGVALVGVPLRVAVSVLGHWYIGFRAHKSGGVRYALDGSSEAGKNLPLLGVVSFGEGFHNNHHANPSSARMGEGRHEVDLGWYLILALERLGLVNDVQATGRTPSVRRFNARRVG
jgi:stearoyl-CoA desaturase (delta-9 desaturase)